MRKDEYLKKIAIWRAYYEKCCEQIKQENILVCPQCGDRCTKILSLSEGCYICQKCNHHYQPPTNP